MISVICHPIYNKWYTMTASSASGAVLNWYRDNILENKNLSFKDLDIEAKNSESGSGSIIFFPYLLGSRNPFSNPYAYGAFFGLRLKHKRSHITRAIMEGVLFELLNMYRIQKKILKKVNIKLNKIKISGGIVKSQFWLELFADILQVNLITTEVKESGCLGGAIMAASAIKYYNSIENAVYNMVIDSKVIKFNKEQGKYYKQKFLTFIKLYKILEKEGFNILD